MADGITSEGALLQINTGSEAVPVWTPIIERSQLNEQKSGDSIDMTTFDDEGFRGRRPGLRSMNISASGNYVPSDAGYQALEDAWLDGAVVDIRTGWVTSAAGVTPKTYTGWRMEAVITDLGENGSVGDKVELSLAFESNGRPTKVTF